MLLFTTIFLLALGLGAALELFLIGRQTERVRDNADRVPDAFVDRITPAEHLKAADYTLANLKVESIAVFLSTAVLLLWTMGGLLELLDGAWQRTGWDSLWQGVALLTSVLLISMILDLPLSVWKTFGIEARFGFNRTTIKRFVSDLGLNLALTLALGLPLIALILWLMEGAGQYWWLWAWLAWFGFTLFLTWAYPTVIAPLFNKFTPLADGELKQRLEALLNRCGFRSDGMFVIDGSERSAHGNAFFAGFGKGKRIVFFDTLLDGLDSPEVEAVLAHELGHYKRRHILKNMVFMAMTSLLGLALLGWLAEQSWFYQGLGVSSRETPALALTLFLLALPVFSIFLQPLFSLMSRRHEFEADDYAAAQTDAAHLITGLVKMYRDNASTLTPDPWYSAFHDSHPPAPVRIGHLSTKLSNQPT